MIQYFLHGYIRLLLTLTILQINEGETGYFPLFKARSLKEKEDHTLNELVELKRLINILVDHHQEEVHSMHACNFYLLTQCCECTSM